MTWAELKRRIDLHLEANDISENIPVGYIDVTYFEDDITIDTSDGELSVS